MTSFKKFIGVIFVLLILLFPCIAFTQTVPVGSLLDDQLRLNSLFADSISNTQISRPVSIETYKLVLNRNKYNSGWWNQDLSSEPLYSEEGIQIGLQPLLLQQTYNSKFPYGENNGAAWYGRGSNVDLKTGIYVSSKYISVNIYPHIAYQENSDFLRPRFIPVTNEDGVQYVAEGIGGLFDAPFRFGPDSFTTLDAGNSSIRLHYKKLETGLSTEPLWWGPVVKYPLVFSNNAAGIPHFFLGSREPYSIPYFGDVQFKWILGYPKESEYYEGDGQGQTRFTNAVNLSYNPAFFKNLTLGVTRVIHMYEENGFSFNNAFLLFDPKSYSPRFNNNGGNVGVSDKNQMASIYVHLRLPEAQAEIYAELFREDHSYNTRDFINQPNHNAAYSFGFQKISYLPWIDFLKTNLEFTNLTRNQLEQVRHQAYFYTHSTIRQGHTNRGQILGAAIGPGSNSQFLSFDAYKGNFKFGIFAQRWAVNDNFHFEKGSASLAPSNEFGDYFRHRINLNLGLNFLYGRGPIYLNSRLTWTKAYNYGRFDYGEFEGITERNYTHFDLINTQLQIGLTYFFNR